MSREPKKRKKQAIDELVEGFVLLKPVSGLLEGLQSENTDPRRSLLPDKYVTLLLLYFFNPTITSLRGLQATTEIERVQRKLKIPRTSLGSLSAAQHVFDPELVASIIPNLVAQIPANGADPRLQDLKGILTVADGTLLRALPRVAWALWIDDEHRAAKVHLQFEPLKEVPTRADITAGNASEKDIFKNALESGRLYAMDAGYAKFDLFQRIIDVGSRFVCRIPDAWKYEVLEERPLTQADRDARVLRDLLVRLGSPNSRAAGSLKQPVRLIEIERVDQPSKRMRAERREQGLAPKETILLVTDILDLPADLIALIYSYRWKIEIFFRWRKCILGCKHLLAESRNGVALQVYCAIIACLLISIWTGRKPNKRLYEMICLYFQGLADVKDVLRAVQRLKPHASPV